MAMAEGESYREKPPALRVLFCFGVQPAFFEEPSALIGPVVDAIKAAFDDLAGRFGLTVLGTMDDDELMVGPSATWPWTAYVLADAPDLAAVTAVCNLVRETEVGDGRLWRYLRVEARVGRPLFFATA
jgi:hypothetical protein